MASGAGRPLRPVAADLAEIIPVCRKCSKRGFGPDGDQKLAKAVRRALATRPAGGVRKRKGRRASFAVVEVDALDLCPRGAIVALRADRLGDWVLVPQGTDVGAVMDNLGLGDVLDA